MDKNMINIDDLVRERLSGGEEKERTGAWLQMRELLDKKMPVEATPVAFGWKRITGYLAGVAILTLMSIGGYRAVTHGDAGKHVSDNAAKDASVNDGTATNGPASATTNGFASGTTVNDAENTSGTGISGNPNSTTLNNYGQDNTNANSRNSNANRTTNGNNRNSNHGHTTAAANTGNQNAQQLAGNTVHGTSDRILKSENLNGPGNTAAGNAQNNTANNTSGNGTTAMQQPDASGTTAATNVGASVNNMTAGRNNSHSVRPVNPEATPRRHNASTGTTSANVFNATAGNATPSSSAVHAAAANNNTGNNNGNNSNLTGSNRQYTPATTPALKKDTIEKIRLVQRYNRKRESVKESISTDTIGIEQMVVNRPLDRVIASVNNNPEYGQARMHGNNTAQKPSENAAIIPASAAAASKNAVSVDAEANSQLVPLSNFRVASRKMAWDPQRFEEMVNRFKFRLAQLKFYPGIIAGINASMFGPNTLGGFQLGLSSTVAFNEHFSIGAELKYISRFNSGVSVKDDFSGSPSDSAAIYNAQGTALEFMSYTRDSVRHYFNFSMLHSIELPVSVRYSVGRFFMMGGLNFAYHLKIAAEEVERHSSIQTVVPYNHPPITWPDGKGQIVARDLNSRFEVGGLFGVGYEMTPAVQLDLRMTKSLWDNAKTNGAKAVSDQLYKSPSIQLSIGYKFSQQKH